jgi:hypothetical protein
MRREQTAANMAVMERTRAVGLALVAATLAGCGGRQTLDLPADGDAGTDAGTTTRATIGPVDLTQAPAELPTTCDHGIGLVAFDNPCLVGFNLGGAPATTGVHVVECTLAVAGHPIAWSFILPLAQLAAEPDKPLTFPKDFPAGPPGNQPIGIGGQPAGLSGVTGTVTFSRVDPTGRAFVARLVGTMTWTQGSGSKVSCAVDAPFWGAPGSFE